MSRTLWFVAGAGAGAYAISRARRVADALTPEGLAGLALGLHLCTAEVRSGMAEKENEVRERLAVASPAPPPQLPSERSATKRESTH